MASRFTPDEETIYAIGFNEGWREAIETFSRAWDRKPRDVNREDLIFATDRLLLALHPDTENLSERELIRRAIAKWKPAGA